MSVTASLISSPSGNTVLPSLQLIETTAAVVQTTPVLGLAAVTASNYLKTATPPVSGAGTGVSSIVTANNPVFVSPFDRALAANTVISATFKVYLPTPTKVGTYVVRVTPAITGGTAGAGAIVATYKEVTITVNAAACTAGCSAPTLANSWSSMYYGANARATSVVNGSSSWGANASMNPGDSVISFSSVLGSQAANIMVYQQNADADINYGANQTANNQGGVESMTATITGPGNLGTGTSVSTAASGRSLTVRAGEYVTVWPDGTSGASTVTITGATTGIVYAKKSISFYGTATKVVAELVGTNTVVNGATGVYASFIKAQALDANGIVNPVATAALKLTGSDTNLITAFMIAPDSASATTYAGANADATAAKYASSYYSYWNLNVGATSATRLSTTKNGTFTLVVGTGGKTPVVGGNDATATAALDSATAVSVRLSNGISKIALAFDKSSYLPGERAVITLTVTDSSGALAGTRSAANVLSTGGIDSVFTITGNAASLALTDGKATFSATMPSTETTTVITAYAGTAATDPAQLVAVTASASVYDATKQAADAATDAALEATDAAYAAQDAAQLAAESADAATAAAEAATAAAEAATAAVEDLATKVAGLFADLQKQITTLANVVAKIAKKVKA